MQTNNLNYILVSSNNGSEVFRENVPVSSTTVEDVFVLAARKARFLGASTLQNPSNRIHLVWQVSPGSAVISPEAEANAIAETVSRIFPRGARGLKSQVGARSNQGKIRVYRCV